MLTGFNERTLGSLISGPGFLTSGPLTQLKLFGVSSGGLTFNPAQEVDQPQLDGLSTPVEGMDRVVRYNTTIGGTMKQASDEDLERYFGSTFAAAVAGIKVLKPAKANTFLGPGSYLRDIRFWMTRGDTKLVVPRLYSALVQLTEVKTSDRDAELPVTILGRNVANTTFSNLDDAPFELEVHDVAPAAPVAL